jgi:hypothetical protein
MKIQKPLKLPQLSKATKKPQDDKNQITPSGGVKDLSSFSGQRMRNTIYGNWR